MQTKKELDSKKSGWDKFDERTKLMFLRFSSKDGFTWSPMPSESLKELLIRNTTPQAHNYITNYIYSNSGEESFVSMGMLTVIRMGSLISHETGKCKKLSIFLCLKIGFILPVEKLVRMIFDSEEGRDIDSKGGSPTYIPGTIIPKKLC